MKQVTIPGLPWYPASVSWPGPEAPPVQNIPFPLVTCISSNVHQLTNPASLDAAITERLPGAYQRPDILARIKLICGHLSKNFDIWISTQQVMNVLGSGPVPAYHETLVPAAPVVNGTAEGHVGHLMV